MISTVPSYSEGPGFKFYVTGMSWFSAKGEGGGGFQFVKMVGQFG